jgi:NADH:ubiquinone oxidoreductase subunit 4 (subunit M)
MYGETTAETRNFEDIKGLELFVAVILVIMILVLGVYPKIILGFL